MVENGICCLGPRGADRKFPLGFFDYASDKSTEVARLGATFMCAAGLSVSPDGHSVLWNRSQVSGYDVKLIEHFG